MTQRDIQANRIPQLLLGLSGVLLCLAALGSLVAGFVLLFDEPIYLAPTL